MVTRPLSRRAALRGAGLCLSLPLLDAMIGPRGVRAQTAPVQRFIALFYPNGTDPRKWNPPAGALSAPSLPECLTDLAGFAAEGIWPAEEASFSEVTVVSGIDHSGVSTDIHVPSMALSAHKGQKNNYTPPQPTLDQYLADGLQGDTPYRNLALSATDSTDIAQGNISFRAGGQAETVVRSPKALFDSLFGKGEPGGGMDTAAREKLHKRQASLLDFLTEDITRLQSRLGAADKLRVAQHLESVYEVEKQVNAMAVPTTCTVPTAPSSGGNWHSKTKAFIDLAVLAMACDLTRVVTIQYSDSWGVNYTDYPLGAGKEALKDWSDHFISHKLDDQDRATDLDGLDRAEAQKIADARVVATSRFKVRRFAYLVNALKRAQTATGGTLLDETLALYASENGDGDSHARKNMPTLLAGHAGGFQTGRAVNADNQVTGALHASIIKRFGLEVAAYGDPAGAAIADL
jgi:hypothetical protein